MPDCVDGVHSEDEWADGTPIAGELLTAGASVHCVHLVADSEAHYLDGARGAERENKYRSVRFVCVSDTRGLHAQLNIPRDPDMVLLHCGNYSSPSSGSCKGFNDWLGKLPYHTKILVPGGLDPKSKSRLKNATHYLCGDAVINVRGVRIFGAPHHPSSPYSVNDTFGASRGARQQVYKNVGPGVHIFATHCPPFGVRDLEGSSRHTGCAEQLGVLRRAPNGTCVWALAGQSWCFQILARPQRRQWWIRGNHPRQLEA